jgi:pimeloyl-ACP methyl ester carboxylesterase/DNA-binding CsgD family transcriptional regulator
MSTAPPTRDEIRFCSSADGTRIAFAQSGGGYPLVKAAHWMTHIEHDWASPIWRPWLERLSRTYRFVRYDIRGCGLSDRDVADLSVEAWVRDLEAVVDAAGLDRFALLGASQGGVIALEYAARHPDRVSELVLVGAYSQGPAMRAKTDAERAEFATLLKIVEVGWGKADPSFRQIFTSHFLPDGTLDHFRSFNELQRLSTSAQTAGRLMRAWADANADAAAPRVRCPTLVAHARGDLRVPFDEGRRIAGLVPGARFLPLETRNHVLLEGEPAWDAFFDAVDAFLPQRPATDLAPVNFDELTPRERQVLERLAEGLSNREIAAQLDVAEKTVRNQVSAIFDKLGVATRAQAIVRAREAGIIGGDTRRR